MPSERSLLERLARELEKRADETPDIGPINFGKRVGLRDAAQRLREEAEGLGEEKRCGCIDRCEDYPRCQPAGPPACTCDAASSKPSTRWHQTDCPLYAAALPGGCEIAPADIDATLPSESQEGERK